MLILLSSVTIKVASRIQLNLPTLIKEIFVEKFVMLKGKLKILQATYVQ
jgi:hypothetical protein